MLSPEETQRQHKLIWRARGERDKRDNLERLDEFTLRRLGGELAARAYREGYGD